MKQLRPGYEVIFVITPNPLVVDLSKFLFRAVTTAAVLSLLYMRAIPVLFSDVAPSTGWIWGAGFGLLCGGWIRLPRGEAYTDTSPDTRVEILRHPEVEYPNATIRGSIESLDGIKRRVFVMPRRTITQF